jgi:hypothetical protein
MNKLLTFIYSIVITAILYGCESGYLQGNNTANEPPSEEICEEENYKIKEDDDDYIWNSSEAVDIQLNGNSISADTTHVKIQGATATIISSGTYRISGTLTDGKIVVKTEDKEDIKLVFDNAHITCSKFSPLFIADAKKVIVILTDGSENSLTDGAVYDTSIDDEPNGTLYSKADLSIFGLGELTIRANYGDGIVGKDGIIIKSGSLNINAVDDAIRGKDYLYVFNGNLEINAGGDALKSTHEKDTTKGFICIENGVFSINCGGDALSAVTDMYVANGNFSLVTGGGSDNNAPESSSVKGVKGLQKIKIAGGNFTIDASENALYTEGKLDIWGGIVLIQSNSVGIRAVQGVNLKNTDIHILKSSEGIESAFIAVEESILRINSIDDCINSTKGIATESSDNSCLTINSGYIYISTETGDAIDANGNIIINGGTVVTHGSSQASEVGVDYNGTCEISGGFFVVSGNCSNQTQAPSKSSTQYSVLIKFNSICPANSIIHVEDSNGDNVLTFAPERNFQSIILSSSELKLNETYSIYTGGNCSGESTDGVYKGGNYTGGAFYSSFTISKIVTKVDKAS